MSENARPHAFLGDEQGTAFQKMEDAATPNHTRHDARQSKACEVMGVYNHNVKIAWATWKKLHATAVAGPIVFACDMLMLNIEKHTTF